MRLNQLITLSLLTLAPLLASAAIYKWVDENGNVQFSSEKPTNAEAEKISVSGQPPLDSSYSRPAEKKTKADNAGNQKEKANEDNKKPDEKRADATKKNESDKLKKEMCNEARSTLATIENSARVRIEDANGEVRYLEEDEITKRKASEQERIKKYCQ